MKNYKISNESKKTNNLFFFRTEREKKNKYMNTFELNLSQTMSSIKLCILE